MVGIEGFQGLGVFESALLDSRVDAVIINSWTDYLVQPFEDKAQLFR
jgi:hypothetical protein